MKTIDVIVSPDGSSRIETKGFTGNECQKASRTLEEALGIKQREQFTADYYRQDARQSQQARQQQ